MDPFNHVLMAVITGESLCPIDFTIQDSNILDPLQAQKTVKSDDSSLNHSFVAELMPLNIHKNKCALSIM